MDDFGYVGHVDVHVDELLEVEVDVALGEAEHAVADVRLHARLLRIHSILLFIIFLSFFFIILIVFFLISN